MVADDLMINDLYNEVCEEYNQTSFAKDKGWIHVPNNWSLIQIKTILKYIPSKNAVFLDIGTGSGIAPRFVKKMGIRSISIDWPITGGYEAIETVKLSGVEGYYCEVGREPIPIENNIVDVVLIADVLEHLPHSPSTVLKDIYRILKPGGVCIATVPNAVRLTVRCKVALGYSNWPYIGDYYHKHFNDGHHHEYTAEEFKKIFYWENFVLEKFELYEVYLRYSNVPALSNMQSRNRTHPGLTEESSRIINIARYPLLFITQIFSNLRSSMLIVSRKRD